MRTGLIIFIRNPIAGRVKTRLAKTLGNEKALDIYNLLLTHTRSITKHLSCDKFLYYSDHATANDVWENDIFHKRVQPAGELGVKMSGAFRELFEEGYDRLLIIGSDCIELDEATINSAFDILNEQDVVIGPSSDGGYYLLGMKRFLPFVFLNKQWSSSSVLEDTIRDLVDFNIGFEKLPLLNDIDEEKDLPPFLAQQLR